MRPFFQWCDNLTLSNAIRDSRVLFPIIESLHILALTILLGTVIVLACRLLGFGLRRRSPGEVYGELSPLRTWSLAAVVTTGFLLFCSEAMKCYSLPPFRVKMAALALAIVFQYTAVRAAATRGTPHRLADGTVAFVSLLLWFGVGMAGRAIGFY